MKILVVDDSATARMVAKKSMQMVGVEEVIEFQEAIHGADAITKLENERFDLVLCDVNMPVMSGFTFIRNIKMDERFNKIPVIFVTSLANDARSQNLLKMGAVAVISKPIKMAILKRVCQHLGFCPKEEEEESNEGWG